MGRYIGAIKAICVSAERGTRKARVESAAVVEGWGVEGDAHGGDWHRQVSLLSQEKIDEFIASGARVDYGDFGENLVVEGIDLSRLRVGTIIKINDVALEVSQIGKRCHAHCSIYEAMGDCIMPREGIFARVANGGRISVGDEVVAEEPRGERLRAAVVTLSDKGYRGERVDESGPLLKKILEESGYLVEGPILLPDDRSSIEEELIDICDRRRVHLVVTTGGTGFSKRDVAPEATLAVSERAAPGVAEAIRAFSMGITGRAMLGRGASAIRGDSLIVNLPGSPKAAGESLRFALPHLRHGIEVLIGEAAECASEISRLE